MKPIGRLHVLTDSSLQSRFDPLTLARLALENGAEVIQYRRKDATTRVMIEEAVAIRSICRRPGVPLIVDDRVDVALAADADGVHLGEHDLPLTLARDLLGPHRYIGGSADNAEEAKERQENGVDYIGIGPIFGTSSKADAGPILGLEGLARAAAAAELPLIAIGGITPQNLSSVLATGVHGVAVLSAVCLADDPAAVTASLRTILDAEWRGSRWKDATQ